MGFLFYFILFPGLHDDPSAGVQGEARAELRGRAKEGVQKGFLYKKR